MFIKKHLTLVLLALALVITICLSFGNRFKNADIVFNQTYQEDIYRDFDSFVPSGRFHSALSNYSARLNNFFSSESQEKIDVNNPISVLDYVFSNTPYYAIVYPTELYYYYSIPNLSLSGNMRLVDTSKGELSFAYFDTNNSMNFKHVMLTEKDGVYIKIKSDSVVKITYKDKSVYFKLPPQKEDKPENANLLPEEEFIARVQDESGLRFLLLFNSSTKSFYYMLNPEQPMTENVKDMGENLFLGERTKYVYYEDTALHRKILIGVNSYNIMDNNYYDGPFDQFPPYLEIRDKMYKAYPYTQYMKGLDPNGNFLDFEGSRVAISSYVNYYADDLSEIKDVVKACTKDVDAGKDLAPSIFLSCLTYESKKDFHKTIPEFFKADGTLLPQKGI